MPPLSSISSNPYDNRPFTIATLDPANPGQGYIISLGQVNAAIRGAEKGARYRLAPVDTDGISYSGDASDTIDGPVVGDEIDEFIAKRGGVSGRLNGGDVAPWPAWVSTPEKFTAILEPADVVLADPRDASGLVVDGAIDPANSATDTAGEHVSGMVGARATTNDGEINTAPDNFEEHKSFLLKAWDTIKADFSIAEHNVADVFERLLHRL